MSDAVIEQRFTTVTRSIVEQRQEQSERLRETSNQINEALVETTKQIQEQSSQAREEIENRLIDIISDNQSEISSLKEEIASLKAIKPEKGRPGRDGKDGISIPGIQGIQGEKGDTPSTANFATVASVDKLEKRVVDLEGQHPHTYTTDTDTHQDISFLATKAVEDERNTDTTNRLGTIESLPHLSLIDCNVLGWRHWDSSNTPKTNGYFIKLVDSTQQAGIYEQDTTAVNGLNIPSSGGHVHPIPDQGYGTPNVRVVNAIGVDANTQTYSVFTKFSGEHSHTLKGDTETKPKNLSYYLCIK